MIRASWGERWTAWIRGHHRFVLAAWALLFVVGGLCSFRLELRTSLRELLPRGDRGAHALQETERRLGDLTTLVVAVGSPDRDANLAYAQRLAERIEALGPAMVERAVWRIPTVRQFFEHNRFLYADEAWLRDLLERIRFERLRRSNPFYFELDEPPTLDELKRRAHAQEPPLSGLKSDYFETDGGTLVAVLVMPGSAYEAGSVGDLRLEQAVKSAIAAVPPSTVDPRIDVSLAGEVHTSVEERRAVEQDVVVTSVVVMVLVGMVVGIYFGRLRAIPLMAVPAVVGATIALGFAGVAFGALNATTAFLGAIIVGNGINYPILVQARYEEERQHGLETAEALARAVDTTARPTALAAFAAAVAYGSLAVTRFRGFSQFGVIEAFGMALCWLASMTLLPALLWQLDRRVRRARKRRLHWLNFGTPFARIAARAPAAAAVCGLLLTVACIAQLPGWAADPYEYDFRNLRSVEVRDGTSERLGEFFGRALSPSIMMVDSRADAPPAKEAVLAHAAKLRPNPVAHVLTLDDLLPGSVAAQERKLRLIDDIRMELSHRNLDVLSAEKRAELNKLQPPADLRPVTASDLPRLAIRPFREKDGTLGRVVLVFPPRSGFSTWNGHDLFRLADAVGEVRLANGKVFHGAGHAVTYSSMISAIAHDGGLATLASFAGVALLTVGLLRGRPAALPVLGVLCLGVLWMLGVAAIFDMKLNFLNFIALPITFGNGVDYGANVVTRYRLEGRGSIIEVLRTTGGAVTLNSLTTTFGYAALLLAHNRALRSFGGLAILGEMACLLAAVVVLPSVVTLFDRRRRRRTATVQPLPAR